jgi:hypothetical protein
MMVAANRKRTATALHDGRNHASVPTLYADLQDQTEAQSQTTWERGSQTSISGSRTSHFAGSEESIQLIRIRLVRRAPGCSDENKGSRRKNRTSGDRPPTTCRRLKRGKSASMQGLAPRKTRRTPEIPSNDKPRAYAGFLHGSGLSHPSYPCHTSRPNVSQRECLSLLALSHVSHHTCIAV